MSRADLVSQCRSCGAPTDAFLCRRPCGATLEKILGDLPELLEALADRASGFSRTERSSSQATRTPDADWKAIDGAMAASALPGDLQAAALLDEVTITIGGWARHLAETRGLAFNPRSLAEVVRWELAHIESIRYDEAAAEILTEFDALHRRLTRAVDSAPARFWAGPCKAKTMEGVCERDLYTRFNPFAEDAKLDATFTCDGWRGDGRGCGATHKVSDRLGYVLDSVTDALVPLDVLRLVARSRGMPWPVSATIRSWIFRGQLAVRGVSRGGDELFRGGDVIDLVEQWADKVANRSTRSA